VVTLALDYTCQFTDSGVVLGQDFTTPTTGADGGFLDAEFEDMRIVTIEGIVYNADSAYLNTLKGNFSPGKSVQPLYFRLPGSSQQVVYGKSLGFRYKIDMNARLNMFPFQVQIQCEDPTIFTDPAIVASSGLVGTTGGFAFNFGFPLGFGTTTASAAYAAAPNAGNKPADATIVITGPVINPAVVQDVTGYGLYFNYSLVAGDTLTISLRNRTVMLNGTANRRSTLLGNSTWFLLQPGNNSILFLGTAGVDRWLNSTRRWLCKTGRTTQHSLSVRCPMLSRARQRLLASMT
jgi:hypothetical protein